MVGSVRLCRKTDETTSRARQREQLTRYADLHGHKLMRITETAPIMGRIVTELIAGTRWLQSRGR
jgi:hypothetical protein